MLDGVAPRTVAATALIFLAAILLSSCSGTRIRHLDAEAFLRQTEKVSPVQTVRWITYIGHSDARAYLEYGDLLTLSGKPSITVYWTELDGLPAPIAAQLKEGKNPWPWPPEWRGEEPGSRPAPKK